MYLTDLADIEEVNTTYAAFFDDSPPARVAVQVAALASGARNEIDAIAVVCGVDDDSSPCGETD